MKKLSSVIIAIVLSVSMLVAFAPINDTRPQQAEALSPEYISSGCAIYYFSDSTPLFRDYLDGENSNVVYDVHPLISSCELEYLLFTGYFWGFEQNTDLIFILELKASMISAEVVNTLLYCVKEQGANTLLVTPYVTEYSDCLYADEILQCSVDGYANYLRNVANGIMIESGYCDLSFFILFVDGRMVGLDNATQPYDLVTLCMNSPTLRKLYYEFFTINDQEADPYFEYELYLDLWNVYNSVFLNELQYDFDAMNHGDIASFIGMWSDMESMSDDIINDAQANFDYAYNETIYSIYSSYYMPRVADIQLRHSHMFAHISNNLYVDLFSVGLDVLNGITSYDPCELTYHTFDNLSDITNPENYSYLGQHIFAMGQWYLPREYYDLLLNIQESWAVSNMPVYEIAQTLPVYIWPTDPFVDTNSGLIVKLESQIGYLYGNNNTVDYDDLLDMFTALLSSLT